MKNLENAFDDWFDQFEKDLGTAMKNAKILKEEYEKNSGKVEETIEK